MNDERLEQDSFTDDELKDFASLFNETIKNICIFADKHNFDRDDIAKYFAERFDYFADIATIENYRWGD